MEGGYDLHHLSKNKWVMGMIWINDQEING